MGDGHQFVAALLQRSLHLLQRGRVADRRGAHLGHDRAVALQDGGETIAEVAGVHHQRPVARFNEVGGGDVHGQRAGPGDDEGLPAGAQEHLAQPLQRLAEDLDEVGGDVAGGGHAHRLQHLGGELDGAGDHEQFSVFHRCASPLFEIAGQVPNPASDRDSAIGGYESRSTPVLFLTSKRTPSTGRL